MRYLPDKKIIVCSPALASARIAPKICQDLLQRIYSEYSKFHPNPDTFGGVIAGRVNIVETRHKVFPILGETSSPSKEAKELHDKLWLNTTYLDVRVTRLSCRIVRGIPKKGMKGFRPIPPKLPKLDLTADA